MIAVNSQRAIVSIILLGLATLLDGRGRKGLDRLPVHGTVTFANGEKPDCSITFVPDKGHHGPSATARLVEGSYKFDRSNGPTAGPHTVTIRRITGRALEQIAEKKVTPPPSKIQWTESADVADDGRYVQNFDLKD